MTNEEKAKAYDEALARCRWQLANNRITEESATDLFRELAESEDEKIREFLYEFIKICAWSEKQYPPREKCLAYLEKQKENPKSVDSIPSNCVPDVKWADRILTYAIVALANDVDYNRSEPLKYKQEIDDLKRLREEIEKQKEPKPNIELIQKSWYMEGYHDREFNHEPKWIIKTGEEGPRYEENPKYGQIIEQKPIEPSDDELQRHQKKELYDFKVFAAKQAKEHHISFVNDFEWNNFCDELLSFFYEKHTTDGKALLHVAEKSYQIGLRDGRMEQKPDKCKGCNNVKGCITCVDGDQWAHIEEVPENGNSEKPNTQWSEEDEKMLVEIIGRGSSQIPPFEPALREEQMEWLMNRLKSLRPQSKEELTKMLQDEYNKGKEAGEKEGYTKGYNKGYKDANESVYYHFPVMPTSPSGWGCDGTHCTNPHMDCINCPIKYTGGILNTVSSSGDPTLKASLETQRGADECFT